MNFVDVLTGLPVKWLKSVGGAASVATKSAGLSSNDDTLPIGTEVIITDSLTKVADVSVNGKSMVEIAVTTNPLDQFEIRGKVSGGSEQTLFSSSGDYTNPAGILIGTSGDLTSLAVGTGWFIIEPAVQNVVLYAASSNVAGSGVTIRG